MRTQLVTKTDKIEKGRSFSTDDKKIEKRTMFQVHYGTHLQR